jgi:LacI family transcriptional regulator
VRVTLKDLAKETGYSVTTVSRALTGYDDVSQSTRAIILDAAERLGYQPNLLARQLQSSRTDTLSLILPAYGPRFADAFFSEFLAGVGTEVNAHSYDLLLSTQASESEALATYKRVVGGSRIDGMMVLRTRQDDPRIQYLHETGLPFVTYGRSETDFPFNYVDSDGELGLRLMTEHFIELGHRRIAFVSAMSDLMFTKHRLIGYQQTLEANGINFDPDLVVYGDLTQQSGLMGGTQILQLEAPPTAIIAANDLMALGVFSAIRQVGLRVGEDVAVGGYDDTPLAAHADPPLTSVDCLVFESGRHVCRLLINLIRDESLVGEHILLEPALVVRESSGSVRR